MLIKKCFSTILCLSFTAMAISPLNIKATENITEIKEGVTEGVRVYKNEDTGVMSAEIGTLDFEKDKSVIVYQNEEEGITVGYDLISSKPDDSIQTRSRYSPYKGSQSWSAGKIPSGTHILSPWIHTRFSKVQFYEEVKAYPVKILSAYNKSIEVAWGEITSSSLKVLRASPSGSLPARATLELTGNLKYGGQQIMHKTGFLTAEYNSKGQSRLIWDLVK